MLTDEELRSKIVTKKILVQAFQSLCYMPAVTRDMDQDHVQNTPTRAAVALIDDLLGGCWENPVEILRSTFNNKNYDEIVYVNETSFVSMCAHHLLPFMGKAYFGYLPGDKLVGLSKIPRLIHCFARRPQVQEKLTAEIVDMFMDVLNPKGCGLVMEANHLCMAIRGVEEPAYTKTTALRGVFRDGTTKQEFLHGISKTGESIWP